MRLKFAENNKGVKIIKEITKENFPRLKKSLSLQCNKTHQVTSIVNEKRLT